MVCAVYSNSRKFWVAPLISQRALILGKTTARTSDLTVIWRVCRIDAHLFWKWYKGPCCYFKIYWLLHFNLLLLLLLLLIIIIMLLLLLLLLSSSSSLLCLVTYLFSLVLLLLNQRWSPPQKLQVSHCSIFHIMCGVPSIAVFCSESIECFPGMTFKIFLKPFVTIVVAPVITGVIIHSTFHIHYIALCINSCILASFLLPFAWHFSQLYYHIYQYARFLLFVFNYYIWPICCNFSGFVYCLIPPHCNIFQFKHWLGRMCVPFVISVPRALHIE